MRVSIGLFEVHGVPLTRDWLGHSSMRRNGSSLCAMGGSFSFPRFQSCRLFLFGRIGAYAEFDEVIEQS